MSDILVFVGLLSGWVIVNVWVLPLFGIQTCMSGACRVPRADRAEPVRTTRESADERETPYGEELHKP